MILSITARGVCDPVKQREERGKRAPVIVDV